MCYPALTECRRLAFLSQISSHRQAMCPKDLNVRLGHAHSWARKFLPYSERADKRHQRNINMHFVKRILPSNSRLPLLLRPMAKRYNVSRVTSTWLRRFLWSDTVDKVPGTRLYGRNLQMRRKIIQTEVMCYLPTSWDTCWWCTTRRQGIYAGPCQM